MINNSVVVGRLSKDIDLKYTQDGKAIASTTIACERSYKNSQGKHDADFIPIKAFGKTAECLANYAIKGKMIAVHGSIRTGSYTAKDGTKRYTTELFVDQVQILEWENSQKQDNNDNFNGFEPVMGSEDIPF